MFKWLTKCEHKFVKDKNNLYCNKCGKYVRMTCDHQWKEIDRQFIETIAHTEQLVITKECKICGKIITLNLTTGRLED